MTSANNLSAGKIVHILHTRLHPPPLTKDLVPRPHLLEELEKGLHRPLTLISAPAGYGKSTLLSFWLKRSERASAWLSLDESDNDVHSFINYFFAAIQTRFPLVGRNTLALMSSGGFPPPVELANSVINELDAIEELFILVLDDFHLIENKVIHELISHLLRHPPRYLHLALAVRRDPPLPLAGLRGRNMVTDIRMTQLRFSKKEIELFLQKNIGIRIDDDTTRLLEETTEGWITGLRLAALFYREQADIDLLKWKRPKNNLYIMQYLVEEVLTSLDSSLQDFLLKTSILDRLNGSLCDAVTLRGKDGNDSRRYLKWLERQSLFTIPLDDEEAWWRYHHLFQQALQRQLRKRMSTAEISELHRRASQWFAANGFLVEALDHALAAGRPADAMQLLERNAPALLNEDHWYMLEQLLSRLPQDAIRNNPRLLLVRLWVAYFKSMNNAIPSLVDAIESLMQRQLLHRSIQGELDFFRGVVNFWDGKLQAALKNMRSALALLPRNNLAARSLAVVFLALSLHMCGQVEEAKALLQKNICQYEDVSDTLKHYMQATLVILYLLEAETRKAEQAAQIIFETAEQDENIFRRAWGGYLLGVARYLGNHLQEAQAPLYYAAEKRYFIGGRGAVDSLVGMALCSQALARTDRVEEALQRLQEFDANLPYTTMQTVANSTRARIALLHGDAVAAERFMQSVDVNDNEPVMVFWLETPAITKLKVMLTRVGRNNCDKVLQNSSGMLALVERQHNTKKKLS